MLVEKRDGKIVVNDRGEQLIFENLNKAERYYYSKLLQAKGNEEIIYGKIYTSLQLSVWL